jgi:hypothetical protein
VATWDDIRQTALALPGVRESDQMGELAFQVGTKGFVQTWRGRVVMKLDKHHQELLFEVRPEVFTPMVAGALRWSWVAIDRLDTGELAELVREAWTCVVPKKVSRAFLPPPFGGGQPTRRRRQGGGV